MMPISWGMSMKLSRWVARSIVAQTRAAAAMPTGWLRPSSASESPVNPKPLGNWSPNLPYCGSASSGARPISPAIPPEIRNVSSTIRFGLMPAALAADGFWPDTRRSKPKRLRLSRT